MADNDTPVHFHAMCSLHPMPVKEYKSLLMCLSWKVLLFGTIARGTSRISQDLYIPIHSNTSYIRKFYQCGLNKGTNYFECVVEAV